MSRWDKTIEKPDTDRFVLLTFEDGTQKQAQYIVKNSPFRKGKQWVSKEGKYSAIAFNPVVDWQEIEVKHETDNY